MGVVCGVSATWFAANGVMSTVISGLTAFAALATAAIALTVAVQLRNRERRLALVELHSWLTTGETASARDAIGSLLFGKGKIRRSERGTYIAAYFNLIWALQRARNTFNVYGFSWRETARLPRFLSRRKTALLAREADSALTWNVAEMAENVDVFYRQFSHSWGVSDRDAWQDISPFVAFILSRR